MANNRGNIEMASKWVKHCYGKELSNTLKCPLAQKTLKCPIAE